MNRFSQLYAKSTIPVVDSRRFRLRLGGWLENYAFAGEIAGAVHRLLQTELGAEYPYRATYAASIANFLLTSTLPDALDTITLIDWALKRSKTVTNGSANWHFFINRLFVEENLTYKLGDDGVVHPFIDAEFEDNRASALLALGEDCFAEARSDFEASFRHLRNGEGKQSIRMMFPALEVTAKILFPGAISRLMPQEVERFILPKLQAKYADNAPALIAGRQLLLGFKEWIIASQQYRHGQEVQESIDPPTDFLVAYLSSGATYLRWIIDLCR